jgi:alpha-beta hydrolase superfamily lysophospholipase
MVGLVDIIDNADLSGIKVPTLMIYSPKDKVISVPSLMNTFQRLGSSNKQLIEFNESEDPDFHALAGDLLSPSSTADLASKIIKFINEAVD